MNYPVIQFKPQIAPLLPVRVTRGLLVGSYLVVSYATTDLANPTYAIYNTQGRRLFNASYSDVNGALEMAEWLNKAFGNFFPVWEEYPNADVFGLAKWSVNNGLNIYDALKRDHGLR